MRGLETHGQSVAGKTAFAPFEEMNQNTEATFEQELGGKVLLLDVFLEVEQRELEGQVGYRAGCGSTGSQGHIPNRARYGTAKRGLLQRVHDEQRFARRGRTEPEMSELCKGPSHIHTDLSLTLCMTLLGRLLWVTRLSSSSRRQSVMGCSFVPNTCDMTSTICPTR